MFTCKHCNETFDGFTAPQKANHSRWCTLNPLRSTYNKGCPQLNTPEVAKKRSDGIKKAHQDGKYKDAPAKALETRIANGNLKHTEEARKKMSIAALQSSHRRLVRSVRPYTTKDGSIVMLDSSWEEVLATRLDEMNIEWIRPSTPVIYTDKNGVQRKYFPDFYLPAVDLFLDPKNPYAVKTQKDKLEILFELIPNLRVLTTIDECKKFTL